MNDLIRPSLYDAFHFIWPAQVQPQFVPTTRSKDLTMNGCEVVDVVGPICEGADFLAKDRPLPPVQRGDLICVFTAGAYGFTMSSNYNARPAPQRSSSRGTISASSAAAKPIKTWSPRRSDCCHHRVTATSGSTRGPSRPVGSLVEHRRASPGANRPDSGHPRRNSSARWCRAVTRPASHQPGNQVEQLVYVMRFRELNLMTGQERFQVLLRGLLAWKQIGDGKVAP